MKTQFNWKTSRAAFSTFKKFLFLYMGKIQVSRPENSGTEETRKAGISHSGLAVFCKEFGGIGRAAVSAHMQGFVDAGFITINFIGNEKFYQLNKSPFRDMVEEKTPYFGFILGASDTLTMFLKLFKELLTNLHLDKK